MKVLLSLSIFFFLFSCTEEFDWYQNRSVFFDDSDYDFVFGVLYPAEYTVQDGYLDSSDSLQDYLDKMKNSFESKNNTNNTFDLRDWQLSNDHVDARVFAQSYLDPFSLRNSWSHNILALEIERKSNGTIEDYRSISQNYNCDFVIDIPKIELTSSDGHLKCSIQYKLFSLQKEKVVVDFIIHHVVRKSFADPFYKEICEVSSGFSFCSSFAGDLLSKHMIYENHKDQFYIGLPDLFESQVSSTLSTEPDPQLFEIAKGLDSSVNEKMYFKGFFNSSKDRLFGIFMDTTNLEYFKSNLGVKDQDFPVFENTTIFRLKKLQAVKHENLWLTTNKDFTELFFTEDIDSLMLAEMCGFTGQFAYSNDSIPWELDNVWESEEFNKIIWTYENLDSLQNESSSIRIDTYIP